MPRDAFEFVSNTDGTKLSGFHWRAVGEPGGAVLIAHGMAEHCLRYERFAEYLNQASFDVIAYDHRGHGRSVQTLDELGNFREAGWDGLVADLAQACRLVKDRTPNIPLFLFGHSMGSFAAQSLLPNHSTLIEGVILSGSADAGAIANAVSSGGELNFGSLNATFEPARTPFDWLSRDEKEVDQYIRDPLCGFEATGPSAASMIGSSLVLNEAATWSRVRKDIPVYIFSGDQDPLHGETQLFESLLGRFETAGVASIESKLYPGGRHEMLNETNRDEVMKDVLDWLERQI